MLDERTPSTVMDDWWIAAFAPGESTTPARSQARPFAGKWLIFVAVGHMDATWAVIRGATRAGKLGPASKCGTAKRFEEFDPRTTVICVYTNDATDEAEKARVRAALGSLQFEGRIGPYKADADTLAGRYSAGRDSTGRLVRR